MATTAVKERPVIFTGESVRAMLAGSKTMTRRLVKPQPSASARIAWHDGDDWHFATRRGWDGLLDDKANGELRRCPFGEPGDRLWVREKWTTSVKAPTCQVAYAADGKCVGVAGDGEGGWLRIFHGWLVDAADRRDRDGDTFGRSMYRPWHSPMSMPRWASRLTLEITGLRVERLQQITEADAKAEGVHKFGPMDLYGLDPNGTPGPMVGGTAIEAFALAWEAMHFKRGNGWNTNPWVWVVSFRRVGDA